MLPFSASNILGILTILGIIYLKGSDWTLFENLAVPIHDEITQVKAIQKQTLQTYIALAFQYNEQWKQYFDVTHRMQQISARQNIRAQEGFTPHSSVSYSYSNPKAQLDERQKYERKMLEHQEDEKLERALSPQLIQARQIRKATLEYMDEVLDVFGQLSAFTGVSLEGVPVDDNTCPQ